MQALSEITAGSFTTMNGASNFASAASLPRPATTACTVFDPNSGAVFVLKGEDGALCRPVSGLVYQAVTEAASGDYSCEKLFEGSTCPTGTNICVSLSDTQGGEESPRNQLPEKGNPAEVKEVKNAVPVQDQKAETTHR